jgi:NADPH:quinone reductase-like Zn-dependent oxidoreductase
MKAITVAGAGLGVESMTLTDIDYPHAAENDVIVRVQAAGFTPGELTWPGTWVDRAGRMPRYASPLHRRHPPVSAGT